jgi:hypothetical protein
MTLVIFIPHIEGISLVADRKNSFPDDGTFERATKIFSIVDHRAIIGCAGSTSSYSQIMIRLRNHQPRSTLYEEVGSIYREEFEGFVQTSGQVGLEFTQFDMLVAKYNGREIELECYSSVPGTLQILSRPCNPTQCQAIGDRETISFLTTQFNRVTRETSKNEALEFAQATISYSSKFKDSIGDPCDFGCDSFTLNSNGEIEENRLTYDPSAVERFYYFRRP